MILFNVLNLNQILIQLCIILCVSISTFITPKPNPKARALF